MILRDLVNLATNTLVQNSAGAEPSTSTLSCHGSNTSMDTKYTPKYPIPRLNDEETQHLQDNQKRRTHQWVTTLLVLGVIFITAQLTFSAFVAFVIQPSLSTPNTDKLFEEVKDSLGAIAEDTIPFVQDWYQKAQQVTSTNKQSTMDLLSVEEHGPSSLESQNKSSSSSSTTCVDRYFDGIKDAVPTTSPSYVRLVLQNLGAQFQRSPTIRNALHSLLTEPQDLRTMYEESQSCLSQNTPLVALACVSSDFVNPPNLTNYETRVVAEYLVNYYAVLETLTKHIEKSLTDFKWMVDSMVTSRRRVIEHHYEQLDENKRQFVLAKYRSMAMVAEEFLEVKSKDRILDDSIPPDALIQLNILEAVKLDILNGREENSRVGMQLAANCKLGTFLESHELLIQTDKDWINAYIAWNSAFVLSSFYEPLSKLVKLIIPAVSCTSEVYSRERFLQRRVISLSVSLMHWYKSPQENENIASSTTPSSISRGDAAVLQTYFDGLMPPLIPNQQVEDYREPFFAVLGQSNLEQVALVDPDPDTVWKMLYYLCGETCHGPSWRMTDSGPISSFLMDEEENFFIYVGFINWLTVVITGIGLEMFMVLFYLKNGWTSSHETQWKLAQFLFSILALTTLGLASIRNYTAILTLVGGLWRVRNSCYLDITVMFLQRILKG